MKKEAQHWADMAQNDFESALYLFKGAYYPQAIYMLCQAIEKLLKATQIEHKNEAPKKTHNLEMIANRTNFILSADQKMQLRSLTKDYDRVRYRDISQVHYNTKIKTEPIISTGKTLYLWIQNQLKNQ